MLLYTHDMARTLEGLWCIELNAQISRPSFPESCRRLP
jgi:hypothetical protein